MSEVLKSIDAEIATKTAALVEIDAGIASFKVTKGEVNAEIRKLRSARAVVTGEKKRASTPRSGAAKAGPAAVTKVSKVMQAHGKLTQADVTRETGLNSGQVSAAIQELQKQGVLVDTGVKVGRTREFEFVTK